MKKIITVVFCLVMSGFAFARSPLAEIDAAKNIKLLEATRPEIIKIFSNGIFPVSEAPAHSEDFYTENAVVRVFYSSGDCSYQPEDWNVAAWTVTEISVLPKDFIGIEDLGIDYSKFRSEKPRRENKKVTLYGDKKAGIFILSDGDRVESVTFSPPEKGFSRLCDKPEVKEYYSGKKLMRRPEMENAIYDHFPPLNVEGLELSGEEISACGAPKISVSTSVVNLINEVLTYEYYISGGKIVGRGANVVWDLTGVKPGAYKITAVADTGCGPCGKFITKTVILTGCSEKGE
jgi:hypothetical protein